MISFVFFLQVSSVVYDKFPDHDWITEETKALVQPYWDCAHQAAADFEKSGEAADLIAIAAKEECNDEHLNLWASYIADSIFAGETSTQSGFEKFEEEVRRSVIHRVVSMRSRNNDV